MQALGQHTSTTRYLLSRDPSYRPLPDRLSARRTASIPSHMWLCCSERRALQLEDKCAAVVPPWTALEKRFPEQVPHRSPHLIRTPSAPHPHRPHISTAATAATAPPIPPHISTAAYHHTPAAPQHRLTQGITTPSHIHRIAQRPHSTPHAASHRASPNRRISRRQAVHKTGHNEQSARRPHNSERSECGKN